ncbi:hypothetical protein BpHYR1_010654, partial [Brachionus plicatilis]
LSQLRINNRNFAESLTKEECLKRLKEQEEAKNAKKAKKGTGRGSGRPRKLVKSKLTPDENDNLSKFEILCSSCETKMAEEKENTSIWLSCKECSNWVCFSCLSK